MKLLLDTHIVLWALLGDPRLTESTRTAIVDAEKVFVSSITVWEVRIKQAKGKLEIPDGFPEAFRASGYAELPITWQHAFAVGDLPRYHNDPFDRMLIAQAQCEGLTLVTYDAHISRYPVVTLSV